jgi:peptide/nickel transport system permease protein
MGRYLLRRLLHSVLVLAGVLCVVFVIGHGLGDPAKLMLPIDASDEQIRALRTKLGLEDPFLVQFGRFAAGAAIGNFGDSLSQKVPALGLVVARIPATLYLTVVTVALTVFPAVALGTLAATWPCSIFDRLVTVVSLAGVSVASFWLGLVLILILAVEMAWLPSSGYGGPSYVILPALTLAVQPMGRIAQVTRSTMLDELSKPYVVTARSKGLAERVCTFGHAFRNAAIPIVTMCGDETASLLNGAVVIETVFGWAGIGSLLIQAIGRRDLPLIEATVFVIAIMIITLNLLVDILYTRVDPRIRFGSAAA